MASVKFWGVRGSIPTPGPSTIKYGGNTSCVEVRHEDKLFIMDAGSGIRELGIDLLKKKEPVCASIFISHMHWDHIQGIPFFTPAYIPGNNFIFYGAEEPEKDLATIIRDQMNPTYFPIELQDMAGKLEFQSIFEGTHSIQGIRVDTLFLNHPGNSLGYKLHLGDHEIVYISDNEPFGWYQRKDADPEEFIGEDGDLKLLDFIRNADLLIHDAQYTPEEYSNKQTWGHSPYDYTVKLASDAGVRHLVLYHHDPMHDDAFIDSILAKARELGKVSNPNLEISAAIEGNRLEL